MLDERAFLLHPATEKNITAILSEQHSIWQNCAGEGLAERDLLVLLLQFLEETLDEFFGDNHASSTQNLWLGRCSRKTFVLFDD